MIFDEIVLCVCGWLIVVWVMLLVIVMVSLLLGVWVVLEIMLVILFDDDVGCFLVLVIWGDVCGVEQVFVYLQVWCFGQVVDEVDVVWQYEMGYVWLEEGEQIGWCLCGVWCQYDDVYDVVFVVWVGYVDGCCFVDLGMCEKFVFHFE